MKTSQPIFPTSTANPQNIIYIHKETKQQITLQQIYANPTKVYSFTKFREDVANDKIPNNYYYLSSNIPTNNNFEAYEIGFYISDKSKIKDGITIQINQDQDLVNNTIAELQELNKHTNDEYIQKLTKQEILILQRIIYNSNDRDLDAYMIHTLITKLYYMMKDAE